MKVLNLRLGHACNSSSSHSIISVKQPVRNNVNRDEFGWDFFTASSKTSKESYFALLLKSCFDEVLGEETAKHVLNSMNLPYLEEGYIDHQSILTIPTKKYINREKKHFEPDYRFIKEMRQFFLRKDIVILGGNDNTTERHPLYIPEGELLPDFPREKSPFDYKARKDGDWWTIYDRVTGNRVTISFLENPAKFKPEFPFLIDLKITDLCYFNCAFCYQGSTGKGKHELKLDIGEMANSLSELGVFEVALGGGEPTVDKERLIEFIEEFSSRDIKVNFTTKNHSWFSDEELREAVIKHCGAVAFSIEEYGELEKLISRANQYRFPKQKINVQVVDQVIPPSVFKSVCRLAEENDISRITVLGFKNINRGKDFVRQESLIKELENFDYHLDIAVDTKFIQDYEEEIKRFGISEKLYHKEEGIYSGYIDMVEGTFNKSSYTEEPGKKIPPNSYSYNKTLKEIYGSWDKSI
jgi:pyruvate-formate lyase-activating enzyme